MSSYVECVSECGRLKACFRPWTERIVYTAHAVHTWVKEKITLTFTCSLLHSSEHVYEWIAIQPVDRSHICRRINWRHFYFLSLHQRISNKNTSIFFFAWSMQRCRPFIDESGVAFRIESVLKISHSPVLCFNVNCIRQTNASKSIGCSVLTVRICEAKRKVQQIEHIHNWNGTKEEHRRATAYV